MRNARQEKNPGAYWTDYIKIRPIYTDVILLDSKKMILLNEITTHVLPVLPSPSFPKTNQVNPSTPATIRPTQPSRSLYTNYPPRARKTPNPPTPTTGISKTNNPESYRSKTNSTRVLAPKTSRGPPPRTTLLAKPGTPNWSGLHGIPVSQALGRLAGVMSVVCRGSRVCVKWSKDDIDNFCCVWYVCVWTGRKGKGK